MSKSKKRVKAGSKNGREKAGAPAEEVKARADDAAAGPTSATTVSDVPQPPRGTARETAARVSQQPDRLRLVAEDAYGHGRETAIEWEQNLEAYIRRKPLAAVLIGLIVGFFLGRAMAGK